jgi:hypothetical protein
VYVKVRSVDVGRVGVCMMCIDSEEHENVGAGQTLGETQPRELCFVM